MVWIASTGPPLAVTAILPEIAGAFRKDANQKCEDSYEPTKDAWINGPVDAVRKEWQNDKSQDEEAKCDPFPAVHGKPDH